MPPSKCLLCSHGQKAVAEEKEEEKTPPNLLFPLPSSVSASLPHTLKEERGREKEKEASKKIYLDPQPAKNGTVKILYDSSKKYGRLRLSSSSAVKVQIFTSSIFFSSAPPGTESGAKGSSPPQVTRRWNKGGQYCLLASRSWQSVPSGCTALLYNKKVGGRLLASLPSFPPDGSFLERRPKWGGERNRKKTAPEDERHRGKGRQRQHAAVVLLLHQPIHYKAIIESRG